MPGNRTDPFAQEQAHAAQKEAQRASGKIEDLTDDVERLLMITEALWSLLKKEHGYSDEVLAHLVQEIDMRDGQMNGRAGKSPAQTCPHCNRLISGRQARCLYCGKPVPVSPFAR